MGIKFECPNGHKLHVKSFLAGKKGLCPECGVKIDVPGGTGVQGGAGKAREKPVASIQSPPVPPSASPTSSATATPPPVQRDLPPSPDPQPPEPPAGQDSVWYVRLPSGDQFGPANQAVFDEWVLQGRIGPTSLVWREGWPDWRNATEVLGTRRQTVTTAGPTVPGSNGDLTGPGQPPAIAISTPTANTLADDGVIQIEVDRPLPRSSSRTPIVVILLCLACALLLIPLVWMLMGSS